MKVRERERTRQGLEVLQILAKLQCNLFNWDINEREDFGHARMLFLWREKKVSS